MLVETSGADSVHDQEKLSRFLERAMGDEIVLDGTLAQDTTQARALWQLRETITEGLAKEGAVRQHAHSNDGALRGCMPRQMPLERPCSSVASRCVRISSDRFLVRVSADLARALCSPGFARAVMRLSGVQV